MQQQKGQNNRLIFLGLWALIMLLLTGQELINHYPAISITLYAVVVLDIVSVILYCSLVFYIIQRRRKKNNSAKQECPNGQEEK